MSEEHAYRVAAWWTSGRTGLAKSDSAPNAIHFTAPMEFGGLRRTMDARGTSARGDRRMLYDDRARSLGRSSVRFHRLTG